MKYFYLFFCIASIIYGIYLFSLHLFLGDLLFHTDIARDFLLIQDIAINHRLTLIGPRAGGIPGTYFGPIWLYLNLPVFILSKGNPLLVGYFWLLLFLFGVWAVYYVARKIFSVAVGIIAITIYIYTVIFLAPGYTQSFAPIVVSPILLYMVYLFVEKKRIRYLSWSAFLCGLLIQFQPAFGSIVLVITFVLSLVILIMRKQIKYQSVWAFAVIPLLTYVLFELRHNFLETRDLFNFIFHHNSQSFDFDQVTFSQLAQNRLVGFLDSVNLININTKIINIFFVVLNLFIVYTWFRTKKGGQRTFIMLVYLYLIGFWLLTFLFKGTVWDYYYWGLYPLLSISLSSLFLKINKGIFLVLFMLLTLFMVRNGYNTVNTWKTKVFANDGSSWIVNEEVAEYVYLDADQDFGFYVYSPDNFGYSIKYAMSYIGNTRQNSEKGSLCTKKALTYLIYDPTPQGSHTNPLFWKTASVSIKTQPVSTKFLHSIKIEKYELTPQEVKNPSDPTMICGLEWR